MASLPCFPSGRTAVHARRALAAAMMDPLVLQRQQQDVIAFVAAELECAAPLALRPPVVSSVEPPATATAHKAAPLGLPPGGLASSPPASPPSPLAP